MTRLLILVINCFLINLTSRSTATATAAVKQKLHIGGVFAMSAGKGGWAGGQACLPAARMALDDVNDGERKLLPDYELVLTWNDSECTPGLGGKVMYDLLYNPPTKLVLMSGCSAVTTLVAEAAPEWNMIVVGYGSSSPALSNRARFPTLFRTHPSATIHNPSRMFIFQKFAWNKIAIIQTSEELFESTANDLEQKLREDGKQLVTRVFVNDVADAVRNLKRSNARIIVGLFYEVVARQIMCQAYKAGLYGKRYVWFILGWFSENWFLPSENDERPVNCTRQEMARAAENHFTTEALMFGKEGVATESGITKKKFLERLRKRLTRPENVTGGFPEAPLAYDAMWAIAKALNCTIEKLKSSNKSILDFHYENVKYKEIMLSCWRSMAFYGISGQVKFSAEGERIMWTQIEQLQNGEYKTIGYYHADTKEFRAEHEVIFEGGKVPQDDFKHVTTWKTVSTMLYAAMACLALLGSLTALSLILLNYKFSNRRFISHSQPQVNNTMLAGCVVCFLAIFLVGLPAKNLPIEADAFTSVCHARVTMLMYGFSLAYGAMFSKMRVLQRSTALSWKFHGIIFILILLDTVISVVWAISDRLVRKVQDFEEFLLIDDDDVEIKYYPKMEYCYSDHQYIWIGVVYTVKGFVLVLGLFSAYEVRNVRSRYVNDARLVGMSIYNIVVLSLITGSVSLVIVSQPNPAFALISITILLCGYLSMGIIFGPKVVYLLQSHKKQKQHQTLAAGQCSSTTSTATFGLNQLTPEEHERLKQLLAENEEIKRQVLEKEVAIVELKRCLEAGRATLEASEVTSTQSTTCAYRPNFRNQQTINRFRGASHFLAKGASKSISFGFMFSSSNSDRSALSAAVATRTTAATKSSALTPSTSTCGNERSGSNEDNDERGNDSNVSSRSSTKCVIFPNENVEILPQATCSGGRCQFSLIGIPEADWGRQAGSGRDKDSLQSFGGQENDILL